MPTPKVKKQKKDSEPEEMKSPESIVSILEKRTGLSEEKQEDLLKQIQTEHTFAYEYIKPKWDKWALRLRLYNNQRRDSEAVGDTLLFSVFQTVLATLYVDRLSSEAQYREQSDVTRAETWNDLMSFDYDEMERDQIDYDWDWDTLFFGRGLLSMIEFDRETMTPVLEVWDPMATLRDPRAVSVNGDRKGRGKARFLGREIRLTKYEMEEQGIYFNFEDLKPDNKGLTDLLDEASQARDDAQGRTNTRFKGLEGDNADYKLVEWITHFEGKLILVTLADDKKRIIRYTKLKSKRIPIIDRSLFPMSKDWDGVSLPDLVEDKQRARAILTNLALKSVKSALHPMYLFNKNKIKNKGDLNFGFNKFIEVDGETNGAVVPLQVQQVQQSAQFVLGLLEAGAQQALATPNQKLGMAPSGNPTATEINEVGNEVDTRHSLSAKIFGWSERRFWQRHFEMYEEHFDSSIDRKLVRITSSTGTVLKMFGKEEMKFNVMPDFKIESVALTEAERINKARRFQAFMDSASTDPEFDRRHSLELYGEFLGLRGDTIRTVLPQSGEELLAMDENLALQKGKPVPVQPTDDDRTHIMVHSQIIDSPQKYAHIQAHKRALMLKKSRPELFNPNPTVIDGALDKTGNLLDNGQKTLPAPAGQGGGVNQRAEAL